MDRSPGLWRIGELSRRCGVSPTLLRAWEQRYGLLDPERTAGGFRLYTDADERRVRRVLELRETGLSPAEAARTALLEQPVGTVAAQPGAVPAAALREGLLAALGSLDDADARGALDRVFLTLAPEAAIREVILPVLAEVGERWAAGAIDVAHEHFLSNHVQSRLLGLAGGLAGGTGPPAILGCAPGELHAMGLLCAALALRARGWAVVYLGQDTPLDAFERAADDREASILVVSAVSVERFDESRTGLRRLAKRRPLAIGGAGASERIARAIGARHLAGDPIDAAELLTAERRVAA